MSRALRAWPRTTVEEIRILQAAGAGSVLDLHQVQTITNGQDYNTILVITAVAGGAVNLNGTTQIVDPALGDQRVSSINIDATGSGSAVNLTAFTTFVDNSAGSLTGDTEDSTLTATNGAALNLPSLTTLQGVAIVYNGSGAFPECRC